MVSGAVSMKNVTEENATELAKVQNLMKHVILLNMFNVKKDSIAPSEPQSAEHKERLEKPVMIMLEKDLDVISTSSVLEEQSVNPFKTLTKDVVSLDMFWKMVIVLLTMNALDSCVAIQEESVSFQLGDGVHVWVHPEIVPLLKVNHVFVDPMELLQHAKRLLVEEAIATMTL